MPRAASGTAETVVAGPDRNGVQAALPAEGSPNKSAVPATADPDDASQPVQPTPHLPDPANNSDPASDRATPRASYQPLASLQSPVPAAADTVVATIDRKNGPHAVAAATDTLPQLLSGDSPVEQTASPPVPLAVPTASTAAALPTTHPAASALPVAQIAPALVTLAKAADGSQQMTVRLDPVELGMVELRISRATSGLTQIDITADKPETLLALQRDQPALHRTLDQAGIPSAGRTVSFHAVAPSPGSSGGSSTTSGQGGGQSQGGAGRANYGNADADGSSSGSRGSYFTREANRWPSGRQPQAAPESAAPADGRTYRVGLDITA